MAREGRLVVKDVATGSGFQSTVGAMRSTLNNSLSLFISLLCKRSVVTCMNLLVDAIPIIRSSFLQGIYGWGGERKELMQTNRSRVWDLYSILYGCVHM